MSVDSSKRFRAVSYFPDNTIYQERFVGLDEEVEPVPGLSLPRPLPLDSNTHLLETTKPLADFEIRWTGSPTYGLVGVFRNDTTVLSVFLMPGIDREKEFELFESFVDEWRRIPFVQELNPEAEFLDAELAYGGRPLVVSVNWATVTPGEFEPLLSVDEAVAREYFQLVR